MKKRLYKPCHCGCDEHVVLRRKTLQDGYYYAVKCPKCGFTIDIFPTREEARRVWNYANHPEEEHG